MKIHFAPNQQYQIDAIKTIPDIFPNSHTLCDQLSWSHYRLLLKVKSKRRLLEQQRIIDKQRQDEDKI